MIQHFLKYWNLGLLFIFLLGIGWIKISSVTEDSRTANQISVPQVGFLAPDFSLESIDGEPVTLADLRGQAVLLNIWASWCPPCRAEMPAMEIIFQEYQDRGVVILAVNSTVQDQKSAAVDFVNELGLTFPILFDYDGSVSRAYRVEALPTSYFIDKEGIIREIVIGGPMPEALLRQRIEKMLKD